jgi:TatD DNase family protein
MLTDAHCHPFDLAEIPPQIEDERRQLGVLAAASACSLEEFAYNEKLSRNAVLEDAVPILPCFGVHPQVFSHRNRRRGQWPRFPSGGTEARKNEGLGIRNEQRIESEQLEVIDNLASEKRIAAIGECGFDLYNSAFRETEKAQEQYFAAQIEIALKYDLPVVLHVRRAIHKIFAVAKELSKCNAVIFHSWPGTLEEAQSLLRRGINAFFSFGNVLMLNHKQALRCCALLSAQKLLTETDAPYQPRRGMNFSRWTDLPLILETAAALRCEAGNKISAKELEIHIEANFRKAFFF